MGRNSQVSMENMTSAVINNTIYIEYPDLNETKRAIDIMSKAVILKNNISSLGYTDVNEFSLNYIL